MFSTPFNSIGWDESAATLTIGNSTQVPVIQFPTSSIQSETGELMLHAGGSEGMLLVSSSFGDIHINVTSGPLMGIYAPGSYQGGNFTNMNKPLRLDSSNSDVQPAAMLNVVSTTQGVLFPRMTTTEKNAIVSPPEGLEVYDLTLHKKCVFTGTVWETLTSA